MISPQIIAQGKVGSPQLGTLRKRLLSIHTLSPSLRVLVALTLAHLVMMGILFAAHGHPLPAVITGVTADGDLIQVALPVYLIVASSAVLGWSCALSAAWISWVGIQLPLVVLVSGILLISPIQALSSNRASEPISSLSRGLRGGQIALVGAILLWMLGGLLWRRRAR